MKQIFLHPDVDEFIQHADTETQMNLMCLMRDLKFYGLTSINPAFIRWTGLTTASVFVSYNRFDLSMAKGLVVKIFFRHRFNNRYYIRSIEPFARDPKKTHSDGLADKMACRTIEDKRVSKYRDMHHSEFNSVLATPFRTRFLLTKHNRERTEFTLAQERELQFYKNPQQIIITKRMERHHRSDAPFSADDHTTETVKFDRMQDFVGLSLSDFLEDQRRQNPNRLLFVNFVDETDPISLAHRDYLNDLGLHLTISFPDLDPLFIDVVICDHHGETGYFQEFERYSRTRGIPADHPSSGNPFIALLGKLLDRGQDHQAMGLTERMDRRLLDIDLIHGIERDKLAEYGAYKPFAKNLNAYTHQIYRAAGLTTDRAALAVKDYRGQSPLEVARAKLNMMTSNVLVSCFHPPESPEFKTVHMACIDMALHGYPYITILLCDYEIPDPAGAEVLLAKEISSLLHDDLLDFPKDAIALQTSIEKAYRQISGIGNSDEYKAAHRHRI